MKKLLAIFLFFSFFTQFSCDPEPTFEGTTDVELVFKGTFGEETFMINKDYTYNNFPIRFDQLNFYIANVVLVKEIGGTPEETELVEVDFVELSYKPSEAADAERGFVVTAKNIPVGEYSGIKINLGVPSDLNKTSWDDYGSGHPLRNDTHYWIAWESFIFSKTEARFDIDNDGLFSHKVSYHTGADEAYRTKFFAKDVELLEDEVTQITFGIDAKNLFEEINILTETGTHNISDLELVNKVMDNLNNSALSIE